MRRSVIGLIALLVCPLAAQQPTFRSGVHLVEANVVVHDKSGNPVTDLKASDFKISEDGKEQKIELFNLSDTRRPAAPVTLPPGVYSNRVPSAAAGSVTAILFDRLNSTFDDQKVARDQILKVLAKTPPGDRVALYVLDSETVTVVHDFTTDASRLVAAINKVSRATSIEAARSDEKTPLVEPIGVPELDADTDAWLQSTMVAVSETFLRRRAELTIHALAAVGNHLAGIPGRKNLVWISASFPFEIPGNHSAPIVMNREMRRAARVINDANVAVYPVDIRGLVGAFVNQTTATETIQRGSFGARGGTQAPIFNTIETVSNNQDAMREVADATGGRAFMNTNGVGDAVSKASDDGRVSYTLGYYSSQADDKFHDLDVKVSRGGLDVRFRKGSLALAPPSGLDAKARLAALEPIMTSPVESSSLELLAGFERQGDDGTLTFRLNPGAIAWRMNKDVREGALDILIAQSTPEGKYFKIKETTVNLTADPERYRQMLTEGFTLSSSVKLQPGVYRLHVVVADTASGAVGSLIIPLAR